MVGTGAASSDEQICVPAPLTGTSLKSARSASKAEWERVREQSRASLAKIRPCEPPDCGS